MPYVVLVGGTLAIVFVWLAFRSFRTAALAEDTRPYAKDVKGRMIMSILGTAAIAWAMWGFGVQVIQEDAARATTEQLWLATFANEHRRNWDADCAAILSANGADGVLYDPNTGAAYTVEWCRGQWSPPEQPSEYSSSQYDQPGRVPPFPSGALFGPAVSDVRCVDRSFIDCYTWDDYVTPPPVG